MRKLTILALVLAFAALFAGAAFAAQNYSLTTTGNTFSTGVPWDDTTSALAANDAVLRDSTHFYLMDWSDDKVYAYVLGATGWSAESWSGLTSTVLSTANIHSVTWTMDSDYIYIVGVNPTASNAAGSYDDTMVVEAIRRTTGIRTSSNFFWNTVARISDDIADNQVRIATDVTTTNRLFIVATTNNNFGTGAGDVGALDNTIAVARISLNKNDDTITVDYSPDDAAGAFGTTMPYDNVISVDVMASHVGFISADARGGSLSNRLSQDCVHPANTYLSDILVGNDNLYVLVNSYLSQDLTAVVDNLLVAFAKGSGFQPGGAPSFTVAGITKAVNVFGYGVTNGVIFNNHASADLYVVPFTMGASADAIDEWNLTGCSLRDTAGGADDFVVFLTEARAKTATGGVFTRNAAPQGTFLWGISEGQPFVATDTDHVLVRLDSSSTNVTTSQDYQFAALDASNGRLTLIMNSPCGAATNGDMSHLYSFTASATGAANSGYWDKDFNARGLWYRGMAGDMWPVNGDTNHLTQTILATYKPGDQVSVMNSSSQVFFQIARPVVNGGWTIYDYTPSTTSPFYSALGNWDVSTAPFANGAGFFNDNAMDAWSASAATMWVSQRDANAAGTPAGIAKITWTTVAQPNGGAIDWTNSWIYKAHRRLNDANGVVTYNNRVVSEILGNTSGVPGVLVDINDSDTTANEENAVIYYAPNFNDHAWQPKLFDQATGGGVGSVYTLRRLRANTDGDGFYALGTNGNDTVIFRYNSEAQIIQSFHLYDPNGNIYNSRGADFRAVEQDNEPVWFIVQNLNGQLMCHAPTSTSNATWESSHIVNAFLVYDHADAYVLAYRNNGDTNNADVIEMIDAANPSEGPHENVLASLRIENGNDVWMAWDLGADGMIYSGSGTTTDMMYASQWDGAAFAAIGTHGVNGDIADVQVVTDNVYVASGAAVNIYDDSTVFPGGTDTIITTSTVRGMAVNFEDPSVVYTLEGAAGAGNAGDQLYKYDRDLSTERVWVTALDGTDLGRMAPMGIGDLRVRIGDPDGDGTNETHVYVTAADIVDTNRVGVYDFTDNGTTVTFNKCVQTELGAADEALLLAGWVIELSDKLVLGGTDGAANGDDLVGVWIMENASTVTPTPTPEPEEPTIAADSPAIILTDADAGTVVEQVVTLTGANLTEGTDAVVTVTLTPDANWSLADDFTAALDTVDVTLTPDATGAATGTFTVYLNVPNPIDGTYTANLSYAVTGYTLDIAGSTVTAAKEVIITPTPTTKPKSSGGGGCSVGGLSASVLLLLAPLAAFMLKK